MGWNPVKAVGDLFGGKKQTINPVTAKIDAGLFNQWTDDISGVREIANANINGLNRSGIAAQDYANTAYQNQLNQLGMQGQSALASSMANTARYGMDSGAAERMSRQNMMQGMLGQQNLGSANMENLANIAQQNLAMQEQQKYGAAMALPSLQQAQTLGKYQSEADAANAINQAKIANMSANAARSQNMWNNIGTVGKIGLAAYNPATAAGLFGGSALSGGN